MEAPSTRAEPLDLGLDRQPYTKRGKSGGVPWSGQVGSVTLGLVLWLALFFSAAITPFQLVVLQHDVASLTTQFECARDHDIDVSSMVVVARHKEWHAFRSFATPLVVLEAKFRNLVPVINAPHDANIKSIDPCLVQWQHKVRSEIVSTKAVGRDQNGIGLFGFRAAALVLDFDEDLDAICLHRASICDPQKEYRLLSILKIRDLKAIDVDAWRRRRFDLLNSRIRSPSRLVGLPSHDNASTESHQSQEAGQRHQPPVGRRLAVCALLVSGGSSVCVFGWLYLDDKRRLAGSSLIFIGTLLNGCGLFFWLATLWSNNTWSWWL